MKLSIDRSELVKALSRTQGIADKRSDMPVLAHVLLKASGETLSVIATDLDLSLEGDYQANIEEEGAIALHAKQAFAIAKSLPEEKIELSVTEGTNVSLRSGVSEFTLVGLPADEFPTLADLGHVETFEAPAESIQHLIDRTLFCVSTDENRHNLSGVYCEQAGENTLRFVATDGHRLAQAEESFDSKLPFEKSVIIPRKGFQELRRLLSDTKGGSLEFGLSSNHALFKVGGLTMSTRLVEGKFPAYQQVIPQSNPRPVRIAKAALAEALKRVSLVSQHKAYAVRFGLSEGNLELGAEDRMYGTAKENLPVEYKDEPMQIGFNARYILDALSHISDEGVQLDLNDELSPGVIRPVDGSQFLAVVMPMRI